MTYDPDRFSFSRLHGSAFLGFSFVLGETYLGAGEDLRTGVPVSSVVVNDGYSSGSNSELSIDPATATATFSEHGEGVVSLATPIVADDRVEVAYDGVTVMKGIVTKVGIGVSTTADAAKVGREYTKQTTYTIASYDLALLRNAVSWTTLPEETAIARLQRWFTVDVSALSTLHQTRLNVLMEADDQPSQSQRIGLLRDFSEKTGLPVRIPYSVVPVIDTVQVIDNANDWSDQAISITTPAFTDSTQWLTEATFESGVASSVSVATDDTRFAAGITIIPPEAGVSAYLGVTFRLGASRLGLEGEHFGASPPFAVDVLGQTALVSRVVQTFTTKHYAASLELATPKHIEV